MKNNVLKVKNNEALIPFFKYIIVTIFVLFVSNISNAQSTDTADNGKARVTGLKNICVHVLQLEKTLKLYREILGFKMDDAVVYHGKGLEGMLVMKIKANDLVIHLSLTSPEYQDQIGPVGNTNHNHFMLKVNDIKTIGDKLKVEGYALENESYEKDKYTFFTGPNGEIIGLSAWD